MKRLAIVVTHPIQYYVPIFKRLAKFVKLKVYYTWGEASVSKFDPGFGKTIKWDIDMFDGYDYEWQTNNALSPGSHHFKGIVNNTLIDGLTNWQPDAILVYGWAYQSHLKVIRHFKNRVPVFFRGDSTLLDEHKGLKSLFRFLFLNWIYSHVDHAFYHGENNKAYFKKYGLTEKQLSFAPHAVDNDRFATNQSIEAERIRQALGLSGDDTLFLFAGKFEEKKDPLLLLRAFVEMDNQSAHLLLAGNGTLEATLKTEAGTNCNIHFLPFQNQIAMPAVYQAADVFCLPSKGPGETWGLAVNEAMACGKPVLVSNKCGCAIDLVINNKNGYIFKSENKSDLVTCLKLLSTDVNKRASFGQASKEIIRSWNFANIVLAITNKLNQTTD